MQSDCSGQLVSTSPARDDVSHHYSLLNAIKQKRIKRKQRKEQQKWVRVRTDSGLVTQRQTGTHTEQNYTRLTFLKYNFYLLLNRNVAANAWTY